MSNPVFWKNNSKKYFKMSSAVMFTWHAMREPAYLLPFNEVAIIITVSLRELDSIPDNLSVSSQSDYRQPAHILNTLHLGADIPVSRVRNLWFESLKLNCTCTLLFLHSYISIILPAYTCICDTTK